MSDEIIRRMMWKEYRMLRGLWIMLAALACAAQVIWAMTLSFMPGTVNYAAIWLYGIPLVVVALFSLGASVILFSQEREEGTDAFLRSLPIVPGRLFLPKVVTAIGALTLLALALTVSTLVVAACFRSTQTINGRDILNLMARFGLAPIEVLAWGILFSLITRRTLVAACLGAAAASLVVHLSARIVSPDALLLQDPQPYGEALFPYRLGFLVLAIGLDLWLGRHWLGAPPIEDWVSIWRTRRTQAKAQAEANSASEGSGRQPSGPSRLVALGHLLWQSWRLSRGLMITLVGAGTLGLVVLASMKDDPNDRLKWAFGLLMGVVTLMGSVAFLADHQGRRFRYFSERPVNPRLVWLSRQWSWLGVIAVWLLMAVPIWLAVVFRVRLFKHLAEDIRIWDLPFWRSRSLAEGLQRFSGRLNQLPVWLLLGYFMLLAFSTGQLGSIFLRSGVLACVLGIVLSALAFVWVACMESLGVSWLLAAAPIPLIALLVSWIRMSDWFGERTGPRVWIRAGLSIVLPVAAMIGTMAACRVALVPDVSPGFSLQEYAAEVTPEARETAALYLRGADMMTGVNRSSVRRFSAVPYVPYVASRNHIQTNETADERKAAYEQDFAAWQSWVADNRAALDLFMQTSKHKDCALPLSYTFGLMRSRLDDGVQMLMWDALAQTRNGKLDAALARIIAGLRMSTHLEERQLWFHGGFYALREATPQLLAWSVAPGQTPERIREAIAALGAWERSLPTPAQIAKAQCAWLTDVLLTDPTKRARSDEISPGYADSMRTPFLVMSLLPWERARAIRVLNLLTANALQEDRNVEAALASGEPMALRFYRDPWRAERVVQPWLDSTPILIDLSMHYLAQGQNWNMRLESAWSVAATRILLALTAWRLEHGKLPETLDELVGPYFERLPRDPFTGAGFIYLRSGAPTTLV
ncbi:MAG TPA: hypothetical protein VGJ26_10890, partial [Pirellulales bacterium]